MEHNWKIIFVTYVFKQKVVVYRVVPVLYMLAMYILESLYVHV